MVTLLMACGSDTPTASTIGTNEAAAESVEPAVAPKDSAGQSDEAAPEPVAVSPTPTATATETGAAAPEPIAAGASDIDADGPTATTTEDADPMAPTPTPPAPGTPDDPADVTTQPELDCLRLTDFALDAENFGWFIVNDNVMGGRSSGGPIFENSAMIFEGEINTNGGGFSSVRAEIAPTTLAGFTHLIVRARTDQRIYKVTLEDGLETRDRRVSQQQTLVFNDPDGDGWQTARIDFDDLDPRIFGRAVDSDPFRPDLATQLGIMISDGVDGPFRIEIDWIDVCR